MLIAACLALLLWLVVLGLPWQPWRCREHLEPDPEKAADIGDVTVLIPARDEGDVLGETLAALAAISPDLRVVAVDDQSTDDTLAVAHRSGLRNLLVLDATPPPAGWTGKLWALQQGLAQVATANVLLLDADIRLAPGTLAALQRKAADGCALVSLCAEPSWRSPAGRWLLPAFAYFFKLLYPFALANRAGSRVAAAAGGVVLVKRTVLEQVGAFDAWRDAIIDDCTLARHVKGAGHACFIGLTHGATSIRAASLGGILHMIARSAFVQLRQSWGLLLGVTALLALAFWVPFIALWVGGAAARVSGALAWVALSIAYLPVLRYFRRGLWLAPALPLAATLFLGATWYSALRSIGGTRSVWKGRHYRS